MSKKILAPLLFLIFAAPACDNGDKVIGTGPGAGLTAESCSQCSPDSQPKMSCPDGQQIACFKRIDSGCGWADRCTPIAKPGPTCPDMVCDLILCSHGYAKDANGCQTCKCNPEPGPTCPTDQICTTIYCEYGYAKDANGCQTCKCNPPPDPGPNCPKDQICDTIYCTYGYQKDAQGCQTCQCNPPPDACAAVTCEVGSHCETHEVTCIKAPCNPVPACVPNKPTPVDPCTAALCPTGTICKSHEVTCIRAPCNPVIECVPVTPTPPSCDTVKCSKGTHCEVQTVACFRAPCPPIAGCVPDEAPVTCGGIAGRKCPGAGTCHDDPSDSCDPTTGGADCGGLCSCDVASSCTPGTTWNGKPSVCACVPTTGEPCGKNVCTDGQVCCNPSCGICTPKGGACPAIACLPEQ
jgi:hypothetical protein